MAGLLAIAWSMIRNVTSGRLLGRISSGTGRAEELTPAQVRSLCSVYSTSEVDAIAAAKLALSGGALAGHLLFTDNTYDIGASGATRPRTVHAATSVLTPLVNNASAALALGNSTYGVTVLGGITSTLTSSGATAVQLKLQNESGSTSTGTAIDFSPSGTNATTSRIAAVRQASGYSDLVFYTSQGSLTERLRIGEAGAATFNNNLTASGSFHTFGGSIGSTYVNISSGSAANNFYLGREASGALISVIEAEPLELRTNNTARLTISGSGDSTFSGMVFVGTYTVATLPAAGSNAGATAQVTDSNVAASGNYGATVAAGGANRVKVFSDGANWVIA